MRRTATALAGRLVPDASLCAFPPGVGSCAVYRNVVSAKDELLIADEFTQLLRREGQIAVDGASRVNQKRTRNVMVELYGATEPFTEIRDYRRKETRNLPGLVWSPTALRVLHGLGAELLGERVDAGRLVEHHAPGFEPHTEPLTCGRGFLYLNLLSDTVLHFDDEATGREGAVLLPQRALMHVAGELRWGWRFGERPERVHRFTGSREFGGLRKRVEPDLRLSLQAWKFDGRLVDRRQLQEQIESALEGSKAAAAAGEKFDLSGRSSRELEHEMSVGQGALGGDLVIDNAAPSGKPKSPEEILANAAKYKQDFAHIQSVIKEVNARQERGESVNEAFLNAQFKHDQTDLEYGFDPSDPVKTWDNIEAKMRWYNDKVRGMNYGGSANQGPAEPRPMSTKEALQRFMPEGQSRSDLLKDMSTSTMPPSFRQAPPK